MASRRPTCAARGVPRSSSRSYPKPLISFGMYRSARAPVGRTPGTLMNSVHASSKLPAEISARACGGAAGGGRQEGDGSKGRYHRGSGLSWGRRYVSGRAARAGSKEARDGRRLRRRYLTERAVGKALHRRQEERGPACLGERTRAGCQRARSARLALFSRETRPRRTCVSSVPLTILERQGLLLSTFSRRCR